MKISFTFCVLVLFVVLLTFNGHSAFLIKRGVDRKQSAVLLIGDHEGINETDVQNAALLVAKELHQHNIFVGDPVHEAPTSDTIYRVVLRRSDEKILFRLSQEDTAGVVLIEREMLLADIEKIDSAASRLVYAFVHRKPIATSLSLVNAGVFTAIVPVKEVLAPGVRIGLSIDELSYAVDVGFQGAWMETGFRASPRGANCEEKDSFGFWSGSIGGRYFFSKQNVSPYVGGGIAVMSAKYRTRVQSTGDFIEVLFGRKWCGETGEYLEENSGIGVYGVLGVEFLRFSRGRLKIELRVDRPFFKLPSRDVMPITVGIAGGVSF